jgi:thiosulfate reductase cytochrome b subunit
MTVLLMSGLQIFNAHPALYWGDRSHFDHPILSIGNQNNAQGEDIGTSTIVGHTFNTTGILGESDDSDQAFPSWATLPGVQWLAMARRWHFFFAWIFAVNGAAYLLLTFLSLHFWRDLLPTGSDLRHIGRSIRQHLLLRFPKGDRARRYNVLQKLAYVAIILVFAPLMVLTGLTMSPRMDASFPFLLEVFGGRQSARTIHFISAFTILGFVFVHIAMVLVSGVWNNMRAMITGWFKIRGSNEIA